MAYISATPPVGQVFSTQGMCKPCLILISTPTKKTFLLTILTNLTPQYFFTNFIYDYLNLCHSGILIVETTHSWSL